jgi:Family of unknown function (DUF5677)
VPLSFRYSLTSREARAAGERLLELTRAYDNLVVPAGLGVTPLAVLGLVGRARYLLRVAYRLADTGDVAAAALPIRAITESVLTLGWFNRDPELAESVWMLDELRTRLSHHKEVADEERRQRARARRRGEPVEQLEPGASLGLLTRAKVREYRRIEREVRQRVQGLPRLARRKKRLLVKQIARMPRFADRAKVAGMPWVYSFAYRFDSNAAAHPTPLTIEQFLEVRPEGIAILPNARGVRPDPYYVAAQLMWAMLELAGRHVDQTELEPGILEVREELERIRQLGGAG